MGVQQRLAFCAEASGKDISNLGGLMEVLSSNKILIFISEFLSEKNSNALVQLFVVRPVAYSCFYFSFLAD